MYSSTLRSVRSNITRLGSKSISSIEISTFSNYSTKLKAVVKTTMKYGIEFDKNYRRSVKKNQKKKIHNYQSIISNDEFSLQTSASRTALGTNDDDYSINTDDVSQLISPSEVAFATQNDLDQTRFSFNENADEGTFVIEHQALKTKEILHEISLVDTSIEQILKALHITKNKRNMDLNYRNFEARLEAEKVLLINTIKRHLLKDALDRSEDDSQRNDEIYGNVTIRNLQLVNSEPMGEDQYFLCVLNTGSLLFYTDIAKADEHGTVNFDSVIEIPNLPTDFKINATFFMTTFEKENNRFHFCPQLTPSEKSLDDSGVPARPSVFRQLGQSEFTIDFIGQPSEFYGSSTTTLDANQCHLLACLSGKPNIDIKYTGFLDMAKRKSETKCLLWTKYWCQLDGAKLYIWNYPNDQFYHQPVAIIDLAACHEFRMPEQSECGRSRSFVLSAECCDYFFSADTLDEFDQWTHYVGIILHALDKWENLNTTLVEQ